MLVERELHVVLVCVSLLKVLDKLIVLDCVCLLIGFGKLDNIDIGVAVLIHCADAKDEGDDDGFEPVLTYSLRLIIVGVDIDGVDLACMFVWFCL